MESRKPSFGTPNPLLSLSSFIHQHCQRLGGELASRLGDTRRLAACRRAEAVPPTAAAFSLFFAFRFSEARVRRRSELRPRGEDPRRNVGVFTVSNSNNEFVNSRKRELQTKARVVPITLDQVYMLKVEGIAFRFMPDPVQIKNALELEVRPPSKDHSQTVLFWVQVSSSLPVSSGSPFYSSEPLLLLSYIIAFFQTCAILWYSSLSPTFLPSRLTINADFHGALNLCNSSYIDPGPRILNFFHRFTYESFSLVHQTQSIIYLKNS
ncbi:Tic22-like family protein [Actinidia rufa]|uniref:Tic22-like family protein n=1 Tax=Actinidia rufa TaxID=165716 RepID=A0A7J0E0V4_9ERIC|nr:Tic22-like family protein [Actinidia rufa]